MGFPFVEGLELADGVGIAPTQPAGSLGFRDRGITSLPTIREKVVLLAFGRRQETFEFAPLGRLARLGGFEGVERRKCLKINARVF